MPKFDIFINPGQELTNKLKSVLQEYFTEKDFDKLSKFGGRIQISLTAPFTDRKAQNNKLVIDNLFVSELKKNPAHSNSMLNNLTKKQIIKVAKILNFPTATRATTKEIKKSIFDFLNSGDRWSKISG